MPFPKSCTGFSSLEHTLSADVAPNWDSQYHSFLDATAKTSFTTKQPAMMIVSGVSGSREQCLVVDHGRLDLEGEDIAVEPCEDALRAGDGREIWLLNQNGQLSSMQGSKCISSVERGVDDGLELSMQNCDKAIGKNDGQSLWEPKPNSQLKSGRQGNQCLSLSGLSATTADVDIAHGQATSATSTGDSVAHGPARAVDGNKASFWASAPVLPGEEKVSFSVTKPGTGSKLNSIDVDWEFPPRSFEVQITQDGHEWDTVHTVDDNPLHSVVSHINLNGQWAVGARIVMKQPDDVTGTSNGHFYYGIRRFAMNSPAQHPIVESCELAAKNIDARDKWFLQSVSEFDPKNGIDARAKTKTHRRSGVDDDWGVPKRLRPETLRSLSASFLSVAPEAGSPGSPGGFSADELNLLAQFRQQHRRTENGYLCAAAGVQDRRRAFTDCTATPTPEGDSGREWCYLEPQLVVGLPKDAKRWGYCEKAVNYDRMREYLWGGLER